MQTSHALRLALAACLVWVWHSGSAAAEERLTVRLDFLPWGVHAAMHLAQAKGWFADEGLHLDIQDGRGSGSTLQIVNAGHADVGLIQVGLVAGAREQGAKVKSFAGWVRKTDLCVLVDRGSNIEKIVDLRGKSLVVFAASPWAPFIDSFLAAGGLDRQTANMVFVDPAALWGTYTAGRADGLMSTTGSAVPIAAPVRPSKVILASDAGIVFPSYGLIASETTLKNRSAALRKLIKIQQRAWQYIKDGYVGEAVDAMMKQRPDSNLNPNVLREQIEITLEYFDTPATLGKPLGWQAEEDWRAALQSLEKAGVVKPGWIVSDYYTNELVR
jgi:NitT/TauT family transport system substrate-binding protein